MKRTLITIAALLTVALAAGSAHAIVPPKNCNIIKVKGHRYNIKSDQVPCREAREKSTALIAHRTKPHGYKCTHFSNSALIWKCENTHVKPNRTIFVIKL